jgi:hypothetical protein
MGKLGKIALGIGTGLIALAAIPITVFWVRHSPTHNDAQLIAINAEAHTLMALGPTKDWRGVPKNRWPPTIASFDPQWVSVDDWGVEIEIEGFFDGGWGYHIVPDGKKPPMPPGCYQNLGRGIYWHGPC